MKQVAQRLEHFGRQVIDAKVTHILKRMQSNTFSGTGKPADND